MEKRTRLVEIEKEYYVSTDGTEFETAEQCMEYENTQLKNTATRRIIKRETKSKRINLLIRPSEYEALVVLAEEKGISLNELIGRFISEHIK